MTEKIPQENQQDSFEKTKQEIKANIMRLLVEPLKVSDEFVLHDYSDDEIDAAAHAIAVCTKGNSERSISLEDHCIQKGINILVEIYEEQISHQQKKKKKAKFKREKFLRNVKTLIAEYSKLTYYDEYGKWSDIGGKD